MFFICTFSIFRVFPINYRFYLAAAVFCEKKLRSDQKCIKQTIFHKLSPPARVFDARKFCVTY